MFKLPFIVKLNCAGVTSLLLVLLLVATPVEASRLLEVCPNPLNSEAEFVKVYVDSNCTLSDGEGNVTLNRSGTFYVAKNRTDFFESFGFYPDYEFEGRFGLSNRGEEIYLIQNGKIVDSFGWKNADKGLIYYRTQNGWDFKYQDWTNFSPVEDHVSGMVVVSPTKYKIKAESLVLASYTLTDSSFIDCNNVTIFLDGNPVGGVPMNEMIVAKRYNVTFLKSSSYRHFHWKFAIADGDKVVITTENWKWNKRGYIVEFESDKIANFLKSVLNHDKIYATEVGKFGKPKRSFKALKNGDELKFNSRVEVFVLPDCNPIFKTINSAKRRLLIQAPYMDFDWFWKDKPLLDAVINASKHADVRIILSSDEIATKRFLEDLAEVENLNLKVKTMDNLHGKMIVADDVAVITSANLNKYGLKLNREVGVVIYDKKVADFLAEKFDEDWGTKRGENYYLIAAMIVLTTALILTHALIRRR